MKFAVRTAKLDAVRVQFLSSLGLSNESVTVSSTYYSGVTIINLDESAVSALSSIRNIEALLLDEEVAAELLQPSAVSNVLSFKSLGEVDEREQYEHLSHLLHIQKATRDIR